MTTGRVAGNSGQHPVSSAPSLGQGEPGIRERLDRPAAHYPRTPSRVRMPEPFAEFYRAIRGRDRDAFRLVVLTTPHTSPVAGNRPPTDPQPATGGPQ